MYVRHATKFTAGLRVYKIIRFLVLYKYLKTPILAYLVLTDGRTTYRLSRHRGRLKFHLRDRADEAQSGRDPMGINLYANFD